MLTAPLRNLAFAEVLDMARRCNIAALEVVTEPGNPHIDPMTLGPAQVEAIKQMLGERRLEFGFNYDPSHLVHQQCDYLAPIAMFGKRIFHTHAKDTLVNEHQRPCLGVLGGKWYAGVSGGGWWRYAIPGFGNINWGQYVGHLRDVGYKGVLSLEHEDATFGPEEGSRHGAHHLHQFCNA